MPDEEQEVVPEEELPDTHPGVDDGAVFETTTHEGEKVSEKVVYDYDEEGNQIGWHKEVVNA